MAFRSGHSQFIEQYPAPLRRRLTLVRGECQVCDDHKPGDITPPHDPSAKCESNGHFHCTCDACF